MTLPSLAAALALALPATLDNAPEPAHASITSTLPTRGDDIRQLAFDGNHETAYVADRATVEGDKLTFRFDRPAEIAAIGVLTGIADEGDLPPASGTIEISQDGQEFKEIGEFGPDLTVYPIPPRSRNLRAIRLIPRVDDKTRFRVAELATFLDTSVARFRHPVEFTLDTDDAPELADWAAEVAAVCEAWYDRIHDALGAHDDPGPKRVRMILSDEYDGVAMAGGGRITGSVKYYLDHKDDTGSLIHETVHIVQRYRGRRNPSWLVEGVADHVRFFVFEPGTAGPVNPRRARYNASYRTSAAFLDYVVNKYDPELISTLNAAMRRNEYSDDLWKDATGKSLEELGEEWKASLNAPADEPPPAD